MTSNEGSKTSSNESCETSSNSTIDIVQSLMQEEFEPSYDKMDFDQEASKVANKDNDSSRSEFERLLSEGVINDSENTVDNFSKETMVDVDNKREPKSSITDERIEDVGMLDDSEDLNLTLDDSNTSIEPIKEAKTTLLTLDDSNTSIEPIKETKTTLSTLDDSNTSNETTKQTNKDATSEPKLSEQRNSTQTPNKQLKNNCQERNNSKTSNGLIQITDIVSQTDNNKTSLSNQTNDNHENGNAAEAGRTESLEEMLESLDGPAEPDIIDEASRNNRQDSSLLSSEGDNAASAAVNSVHQYIFSNCQEVEIKEEVESEEEEEEITYTETFCEEQVEHVMVQENNEQVEELNREKDIQYFKMFECKGLSIELHDIIKAESARDAKAGLYKPNERKCIDIIRKEYKTKAMQDYITRVKRMRLPEENYNQRSTYNNRSDTAQGYTPMVSINLTGTNNTYVPNNTPRKKNNSSITNNANTKNITPRPKKNSSTTNNAYTKNITPRPKKNSSTTNNAYAKNYTPKPQKNLSTPKQTKTRTYTPKKPLTKYWSTNKSTKSKLPPKRPNKIESQKKAPAKMKVKFSFQKKTRQDYLSDDDDDYYYDDNDDEDVDKDYEPSKAATNYKCLDCLEYFETQAELNIHKRMEHSDSSKYTSWNKGSKTLSKNKKSTTNVKKRNTKPVYVKSDSKKIRGILPVYFKSDQYRIDGINGMKKFRNTLRTTSARQATRNKKLNKQDMIQGAKMVYDRTHFYNHELGKNITDLEMYQHMVKKYTIKAAKLCIGKNSFSSFYQIAKSPSDSLQEKITTVREERGHVLITSPLLHW